MQSSAQAARYLQPHTGVGGHLDKHLLAPLEHDGIALDRSDAHNSMQQTSWCGYLSRLASGRIDDTLCLLHVSRLELAASKMDDRTFCPCHACLESKSAPQLQARKVVRCFHKQVVKQAVLLCCPACVLKDSDQSGLLMTVTRDLTRPLLEVCDGSWRRALMVD